jgi:hypothetical protein
LKNNFHLKIKFTIFQFVSLFILATTANATVITVNKLPYKGDISFVMVHDHTLDGENTFHVAGSKTIGTISWGNIQMLGVYPYLYMSGDAFSLILECFSRSTVADRIEVHYDSRTNWMTNVDIPKSCLTVKP